VAAAPKQINPHADPELVTTLDDTNSALRRHPPRRLTDK
jgi:hypothetical protein